jgi:MFS family permease
VSDIDVPAVPVRVLDADRPFLRRTFAALHHRDFRVFFLGQLISVTGTWMQQVAQGWLILVLTGSPFLLGAAAAARALPVLVLAFPAGVVADRFDRRWIIFIANSIAMLGTAVLAVLTITERIDVTGVIILAVVLGAANAFEMPARQSFVVELAGARHLANAIALNSLMFNAARVLGPAVAGLVVAGFGAGVAFAVNAISYVPVLATLVLIRPVLVERPAIRTRGALGETIAYLRGEPRVAGLLALLAANTTFASGYLYLGPTLTRDLGQGAEGFGLLLSATGVGAVVAGVWLAATAGRDRRARILVGAAVGLTLMLIGVALTRSFELTVLLFVGAGAAMVTYNATSNTIIQTIVPNVLRGRIMSLYIIVMLGIMPAGSLLLGALADRFGTASALGLGGIAWGIIVVGAFAVSARLRGL